MSRRIKSFLLAGVAAATMPLAQPAEALLEPVYDCGFVAVRDIVNQSTNTWIAAEYAYAVGIPTVHSNIKVTCWLQTSETYDPLNSKIAGTTVTCVSGASFLCGPATNAPTSYVNAPGTATYWCTHVSWDDSVTGLTNYTRRSTPCDVT